MVYDNSKRKVIIGSIVAVVFLLVMIIGATYAYFSINVSGDKTSTSINIETGSADYVAIKQGISNLHINLSVSDMSSSSNINEFYATNVESEKYKTSRNDGILEFAKIEMSSKEDLKDNCTFDVVLTIDTKENSMGRVLQNGDAEFYVEIGDYNVTYDLSTLLSDPIQDEAKKEIKMETSVTSSNPAVIKGYLKINNTNTYQSYLAGKALNIKIDANNLKCESSKKASDIVVRNPQIETLEQMQARNEGIKSAGGDVQDDLRRFVGDYTTITDNFICFGTTDKDECTSNRDTYMYRIIGVDTQNRLKLIKATKIVKDDVNIFKWNSDYSSDIKWNASELYSGLNSDYFKENTKYSYMQDAHWTNLIDKPSYYVGDSKNTTNPQLFNNERKENFVGESISLIYLSDYLYATDGETDVDNWLFIGNGLNGAPNTPAETPNPSLDKDSEWTMSRYGVGLTNYFARFVNGDGTVNNNYVNTPYAVRPVLYLKSSVNITSGSGSIDSPYILDTSLISSEITSPNLETEIQLNERNEEITTAGGEVQDDLRRFVGEYTAVTDNFICFGTNDKDTCKENMDTYMYRIIGVDTQNRLKVIKATKIVKDNESKFAWNLDYQSDIKWNASELYSGLNGDYFINNSNYAYMQNTQWTNLISPTTYYIGDSGELNVTNSQMFNNERKENFNNGNNISLMYMSDYLYANNGTADTNNWLFIANGLNGAKNNGIGAIQPTAEYEWPMTRYGAYTGPYHAWLVGYNGAMTICRFFELRAVRPVFYLSSRVRLNGTGTIDNPYYITNAI